MPTILRCAPVLLLGLSVAAPAWSQGPTHTPRVHALTNVQITTAPGRVIDRGTIVIRDGLIEAVGASVAIPTDARIWDLDSLRVYPGLIDLAVEFSPPKEEGDETKKAQDLGHRLSVVHPERMLADGLPLKGSDRDARRGAGFTTIRALPKGGALAGQAAILNLGDGDLGENLVRRRAGQVMTFNGARNTYPESLMGVVAVLRQTIDDARWYDRATKVYRARPRGQERPEANAALEAMGPLVRGEEPAIFVTDDVLDLLRAHQLSSEFGVEFRYLGSGEEYKRLDEVHDAAAEMILPVDFPEAPKVGEGGAALGVSLEKLRHWDAAPANPARVRDAGIVVAFTAHGLKDVDTFRSKVAAAIEAGFPEDEALAACTTIPAGMAGLSEEVGTIGVGMTANLLVTKGDLFGDAKIREVWVDGDRYEVEAVEAPKGDPRGTWDYVAVSADGQEFPGVLVLGGEIGALTATVDLAGSTIPATATQSGTTVTISFPGDSLGMAGTVRFSFQATGDSGEGSGNSPYGAFSVSLTRTAAYEAAPGAEGGAR